MMGNKYYDIELLKDKAVERIIKTMSITEDDVKKIIADAERTGEKLYQPKGNRFLAKMQITIHVFYKDTVYVDYTVQKGAFKINTLYKHRAEIKE